MTRQVVVDVIGDSSSYGKALDNATGKTKGFNSVLKGVGMGVGLGVFNVVTGAIGGITDALGEARTAYDEDIASQDKLKVALRNSVKGFNGQTDAIESVISAQMRLGFGDEEQRDSLALLVGSTNDVAKAQELQVAAMDLARLKGIDLAQATDIMLRANEGNYRGLKSVGITLDSNATSTEALAAVTALAGGQAEAYAKGPLGKQEAAQLKIGESMERIGAVVSQVATAVLPIAADAFEAIVNVVTEVWTAIQPVIDVLIRELTPAFKIVVAFLTGTVFPILKTLIGTYFQVIGAVVGWLAKNVLPPLVAAFKVVAGIVSGVVGPAFDVISKKVLPALGAAFKWVQDNVLTPIGRGLKLLGDGANALGKVFGTLAGNVRRAWNSILGAIKRVINTIIRGWNSIKFSIPSVDLGPLGRVGGFEIGTPNIPLLHSGGIVPGPKGSDQLAMLQAGERVVPVRDSGKGGLTLIVEQFYGSDRDIDKFADRLALRLLTQ